MRIASIFKTVLVSFMLFASAAHADDRGQLQQILKGLTEFKADFVQNVQSQNKTELSASKGVIYLKRPDRMLMHTREPDEQVLFTRDGDVYFYDPLVSQVSIFSGAQMKSSPFMLLTSDDAAAWDNYEVKKSGQSFDLSPKAQSNSRTQLKTLTLTFAEGVLSEIKLLMGDGNTNIYTLSGQENSAPDSAFDFIIPEGTEIDDQRPAN